MRKQVLVEGRVQGVGFRFACARVAAAEGVAGSVRNRSDGRVEAVFEGPREAVDRMVAWCRRGPASAHVRAARVTDLEPTGVAGFVIA